MDGVPAAASSQPGPLQQSRQINSVPALQIQFRPELKVRFRPSGKRVCPNVAFSSHMGQPQMVFCVPCTRRKRLVAHPTVQSWSCPLQSLPPRLSCRSTGAISGGFLWRSPTLWDKSIRTSCAKASRAAISACKLNHRIIRSTKRR